VNPTPLSIISIDDDPLILKVLEDLVTRSGYQSITTTSADEALRDALRNAIDLLLGWTRGRLSRADAYALCSIAGDLGLAEVVNGATVAYMALPLDVIMDGPS
jgi:acetamidase/formamidase